MFAVCREKISSCSEKAYESLPLHDASKLLMLRSEGELQLLAVKVSPLGRVFLPRNTYLLLSICRVKVVRVFFSVDGICRPSRRSCFPTRKTARWTFRLCAWPRSSCFTPPSWNVSFERTVANWQSGSLVLGVEVVVVVVEIK